MAEYLLVIDMQTDYVADGKLYNQNQLVTAVNQKIAHYPSDRVIYVVNRFFWEINKESKKFVDGLSLVSNQVFEKRRISCFTNHYLKRFLEKNRARSLEIVGVDGNGCVNGSVLNAASLGYQVAVDLTCLGVANQKKFQKTLRNWERYGVIIKGESLCPHANERF